MSVDEFELFSDLSSDVQTGGTFKLEIRAGRVKCSYLPFRKLKAVHAYSQSGHSHPRVVMRELLKKLGLVSDELPPNDAPTTLDSMQMHIKPHQLERLRRIAREYHLLRKEITEQQVIGPLYQQIRAHEMVLASPRSSLDPHNFPDAESDGDEAEANRVARAALARGKFRRDAQEVLALAEMEIADV